MMDNRNLEPMLMKDNRNLEPVSMKDNQNLAEMVVKVEQQLMVELVNDFRLPYNHYDPLYNLLCKFYHQVQHMNKIQIQLFHH